MTKDEGRGAQSENDPTSRVGADGLTSEGIASAFVNRPSSEVKPAEAAAVSGQRSTVLQWGIGLAISVAALALVFWNVNLNELVTILRQANYWYLPPALALILLGQIGRARSWQNILGPGLSFLRVLSALNIGYLVNNLLPLRLGEVGRALLVARAQNSRPLAVLSTVAVERMIDLCLLVGMAAAFLPLVLGFDWAQRAVLVFFGVATVGLGGLFFVARSQALLTRLAHALFGRFGSLGALIERRIDEVITGLAVLRDPRRFLTAVFWSGLAWVSAGLSAWLLLRAFRPEATPYEGFFVLVVSGLGIAIPAVPGSIGVWQAAVVLALSVFKVNGEVALSFAVVHHFSNYALMMALGALSLGFEGETLGHVIGQARAFMTARETA